MMRSEGLPVYYILCKAFQYPGVWWQQVVWQTNLLLYQVSTLWAAVRDIQSADDIQEALKDLLSGTIQDMLETEMDNHLGYDRYERSGEQDHFHVCEGNDHTTDFKDYRGYLWFWSKWRNGIWYNRQAASKNWGSTLAFSSVNGDLLNQSHFTGIQIPVTNFSGSFVMP